MIIRIVRSGREPVIYYDNEEIKDEFVCKMELLGVFCAMMAVGSAEKKPAWAGNHLEWKPFSGLHRAWIWTEPLRNCSDRTVVMDFKSITWERFAALSIAVHDEKILTAPVSFDAVGKNGAIHFQTVSSPVKMMGKIRCRVFSHARR